MCHKTTTIFACSCVLRNHRSCSHSRNLVAANADNVGQGNIASSSFEYDHINQPANANTASEGDSNKDDLNAASQDSSAAPTITVAVSTPPLSPSGTATPQALNAGASPFSPASSPLTSTSSTGATIGSSSVEVDTPSASIPTTPSFSISPNPTTNLWASPSAGSPASFSSENFDTIDTPITPAHSSNLPFFGHLASASGPASSSNNNNDNLTNTGLPSGNYGMIYSPIAPISSLSLPFYGHSTSGSGSASSNNNNNNSNNAYIGQDCPFPAPTNGTLTPSAWMSALLAFASQQALNPYAEELINSTLGEIRSSDTRDALPSGFYPRHFGSAQRYIHWNEIEIKYADCAGFLSTHLAELQIRGMTKEERNRKCEDCPTHFEFEDKVEVKLGLCKECEGGHATSNEAAALMREMEAGQGQGQTHHNHNHSQSQSYNLHPDYNLPEPALDGQQHHAHGNVQTHRVYAYHSQQQQQRGVDGDGQMTPPTMVFMSWPDLLGPSVAQTGGSMHVHVDRQQESHHHNQPSNILVDGHQQHQQHQEMEEVENEDAVSSLYRGLGYRGD
ncbi:hypothetical protein GE21DRAFT_7 [Neurospora crassa]|uniref:Uncharacterized protein n=1 Tax=Neurospora crassa (strain ATCC 24698 / 74-OR23-1A / CBS 708.71 / DSM 1257 / FGSC 987) TaxID=367110 RepID=Q7S149_NEUCR|nr:hypothetical protein NCU09907 [Neurospora crassa OR74A]EAA29070.3 hypothetical protein NCU09907 [Neurospora crassa OR74A]KHE79294.1 hypothetical protein GE21DRAFT_7 [Neurospora crassa]|eukprot:XP_958306.3 hypothetical protein NCU09907 [Neurospora crassa OR74A]